VPGSDRPRFTSRRGFLLGGAAIVAAGAFDVHGMLSKSKDPAPWVDAAEAEAARELTYPRTATYFLGQDRLPSVATLAKYDVVVINHEWPHRVPPGIFVQLRKANPRMKMLAYVDLVDSLPQLGRPSYWPDSYALWQFQTPTSSRFPKSWLAHTAAGVPVHEYQDNVMTNLTDVCPQVGGQRFAEYGANWVAGRVWPTKVWDGVFLDVWGDTLWSVDQPGWDITGTGVDVANAKIYGPGNPLDRGLTSAERIMRARMPHATLVANGTRTLHPGLLDGLVWESFADPLANHDPTIDFTRYVTNGTASTHRSPGLSMTITSRRSPAGSAEDYRRARFALTATLMQDGYWAPMDQGYGVPLYYDEMDGAGRGRGYLGHALEINPSWSDIATARQGSTGSPAPQVYRRDFQHGIALVNVGKAAQKVTLGRTYRHLSGVTNRTVNNGSAAPHVTVPAQDGVILMNS
jgi:Hypothetical glycosyl hydrolase family 15